MEILVAFLQAHGLLAGAFLVVAGMLKYYITRDIAEIRLAVSKNAELHSTLKEYVKSCEERIETLLAVQDKDISMLKLEATLGNKNVTTQIESLTATIDKHVLREEVYQKEVSDFMGYVYRKLGNGDIFKSPR